MVGGDAIPLDCVFSAGSLIIIAALLLPVLAWLVLPVVVTYLATDELLRVRFSRRVLGCAKHATAEMKGSVLRPSRALVRWSKFLRWFPFVAPLCPLLGLISEPAVTYVSLLHLNMFAAVATAWHLGIGPKRAVLALMLLAMPATAICCGISIFPGPQL